MARHDDERDEERDEGQRYGRPGNGGERERWRTSGRRGRGYRDDQDFGQESDWRRTEDWEGGRGSERGRSMGQGYGAGEGGTQQWGEGRMRDDREWRERTEGYGGRGWESSGLGGPSTYGGTGMYGGPHGAGMTGVGSERHMHEGQYGGMQGQHGGMQGGMQSQHGGMPGPQGFGQTWGQRQGFGTGMGMGMGRGGHYGRGPKGYRRTDERIREDVNEALFRDEHVDASEIEVEVKEGDVTLMGTVDSREAKRQAEDCVWNVSGVRNVTNTLRVESDKGEEWRRGEEGSKSRRGQGGTQGHMGGTTQTGGQRSGSNT